ncbi:RIP metalloprotease RseP [Moraxella sp. FZLJ2107]|uniref:RIP metalloprotease RseP n=1 Tax=unclassified Moraxella TaxID=2685852 RepID=UPI0020C8D75E|nr:MULTISPECIES: RIP metalloprotease RseP [unclassified Moraxella]UTO05168.1 RIP metalloprotease RseP [Moraxella sp. FZLJ2107]UTO21903.1 RIP metalloprotease RseP [Moraxella sp. FZLJ2109]
MNALYMILAAICVLGPLVALHEFGHYIVARLCGVKVLTYSIGFGPKLFGWTSRRSGIDYQIAAIPLGGYVKMLDERAEAVPDELKSVAFNNQHPLKKIAIVAAGPVMNFIIAISLFWVLLLFPSEQLATRIGKIVTDSPAQSSGLVVGDEIVSIDGRAVSTWQDTAYALADSMGESRNIVVGVVRDEQALTQNVAVERFMQSTGEQTQTQDPLTALGILPYQPVIAPVVGEVAADSAAALMGLQVGDRFVSIDGVAVNDWVSATEIIRKSPEKMLAVVIIRDGKQLPIKLMPRGIKTRDGVIGQLGIKPHIGDEQLIPPEYIKTIQYSPVEAVGKAFSRTYELSVMTVSSLGKMITGMIGLDNLSGPITIAEVSKDSFEMGWKQVLSTAAMISLSLAVLNLLPIPVLDGGHLIFYTYELIRGKAMSETVQAVAFRMGAILLLCFMVLAISNDIMRVFG